MPVYVRAGGIIPMAPPMSHVGAVDPLELRVFLGADGAYTLYEDAGEGLDYLRGDFASTSIRYSNRELVIEPVRGRYSGMATSRGYDIELIDADLPSSVIADQRELPLVDDSSEGWSYDALRRVLRVRLRPRTTSRALVVSFH